MMLGEPFQNGVRASPQHHQADENGEVLSRAPATLASRSPHDFLHVMTMAVFAGRAVSGRITSNACSASRCASSTKPR